VASWYGHRNDADIPPAVAEVWEKKFGGSDPKADPSNVDMCVLDADGNVVHSFDAFPKRERDLAGYTARELAKAAKEISPPKVDPHPVTLPDLKDARGIRLYVRLMDDRMTAYRAPIVEVVELKDEDWKVLKQSDAARKVDARSLERWLSQIYPSGVMERTDQRTREAYTVDSVEGTLELEPAGSDGSVQYSVLRGKVRLEDSGPDDFGYEGTLEAVITYGANGLTVRGTFEGTYPRPSPQGPRGLTLRATFESRPD
jgi:hypothetical protein